MAVVLCFIGERLAMAELGRSGNFLAAREAFFCAAIVSLSAARAFDAAALGLLVELGPTLLVKTALSASGFEGSFSSSCLDFASSSDLRLFHVS